MKFIIPARAGSKGFPGKNRKLLEHTLDIIPDDRLGDVYITTDDDYILNECRAKFPNIKLLKRKENLALDTTSIRSVMEDTIEYFNFTEEEYISMLYLTYPQRTWQEINDAYGFLVDKGAKSLLCKGKVKSHPFLCMYVEGDSGKQIVKHNLYRRQDYPECFELSHYICIFKVSELKKLNNNMYNERTIYHKLSGCVIDVDNEQDLERFKRSNG